MLSAMDEPSAPSFDGRYLFSDSCSSRLWLLDPSGDGHGDESDY